MTPQEFSSLQIGDIVKSREDGRLYIMTHRNAATRIITEYEPVTDATQWEIISTVEERKASDELLP